MDQNVTRTASPKLQNLCACWKIAIFPKNSRFPFCSAKIRLMDFLSHSCLSTRLSLAMLILNRISMVFPRDSGRSEPVESKTTQMWQRQGHHIQPYAWTGPGFSYQLPGTQVVQRPNSLEAPNLIRQIRDQRTWRLQWKMDPLIDWRCISYGINGGYSSHCYVSLPKGI